MVYFLFLQCSIKIEEVETVNEELFEFLEKYRDGDTSALLFSLHGKDLPFSLPFAITQLEARRKTQTKIPSFLSFDRFLFPDALAAEQATDERVARFHASLAGSGRRILDLTAGLGIDSMTLALNGNDLTVCEIIPVKAQILEHNAKVLNLPSFKVYNEDCNAFLDRNTQTYDIVYVDPARRDSANHRTYSLKDCVPDVLTLLPKILKTAPMVMVKVSPVLDVSKLINDVPSLEKIYAVCVKGECKELLLQIKRDSEFRGYRIVDHDDNGVISDIDFNDSELNDSIDTQRDIAEKDLAGKYLYEPNAGVMKLPKKSVLCNKFNGLTQVSRKTPLFVSDHYYSDFPGRVLKIEKTVSKSEFSQLKGSKYNIVSRNYPLGADELRKKLKVKEGKDDFIYAFRIGPKEKPIVCVASRI